MIATFTIGENTFEADLSKPIDISIPLSASDQNPIAWYLERPVIEPVTFGDWVGKVSEGSSSTNFNNIKFNPHGHGTHTECVGHITHDFYSINQCLKTFFFIAELISVEPDFEEDDRVITKKQVETLLKGQTPEALIIRTLPNSNSKLNTNYSHTNPPYLHHEAAIFLKSVGIKHLLIDLPSVDREKDEGKLLSHKAFWNLNNVNQIDSETRMDCTITELIYVPDHVEDGTYLLNLQIASFENDAAPSKPVLYKL